jgi:Uma2 family endonuclease
MTSIPHRYTIEEYFRMEEKAVDKHEYDDGRIFCMARGSGDHSVIVANTITALGNALKGTPCKPHDSNLRLGTASKTKFVYPDIQVVCGPKEYDLRDPARGTILNPKVVIEVLSASTETYDRGWKFDFYRDVESMQEYVLIAQNEARVEAFLRKGHGEWSFAPATGLGAELTLQSLNVSISLADIYDGVELPPLPPDKLDTSVP